MKLYNLLVSITLIYLLCHTEKTYDCKYTKNVNVSYTVYNQKECPAINNYVLSGFVISRPKNKIRNDF